LERCQRLLGDAPTDTGSTSTHTSSKIIT